MESLEPVVEKLLKEKKPRQRKPKAVKQLEPVPESVPEPEPVPVQEEPEPEVAIVCEDCGEAIVFSEEEMDIYRKINAHKRKLLRLKKSLAVNVEV